MNTCYQSSRCSTNQPVYLHTIWSVEVGSEYRVENRDWNVTDIIAIRTRAGAGRIMLDGKICILPKDSILLTTRQVLGQYQTEGDHWSFLWFEFTTKEPVETGFLLFPFSQTETLLTEEILLAMSGNGDAASAGMWYLLHHWRAGTARATASLAEQTASFLDMLPTDHLYSVRELEAHFAHSERTLRSQFLSRYGITPKAYHQQKRLHAAEALLTTTDLKLSAIASQCGFSNEYYFSRVFHQHTGKSPGEFRNHK